MTRGPVLDIAPPRDTIYAVGGFIYEWNQLERAVNDALGLTLNLDRIQTDCLAANMKLPDKLNTIETIIRITKHADAKLRGEITECLETIRNLNHTRNDLIHYPLDHLGGTTYLTKITARQRLAIAPKPWNRGFIKSKAMEAASCRRLPPLIARFTGNSAVHEFDWIKRYTLEEEPAPKRGRRLPPEET